MKKKHDYTLSGRIWILVLINVVNLGTVIMTGISFFILGIEGFKNSQAYSFFPWICLAWFNLPLILLYYIGKETGQKINLTKYVLPLIIMNLIMLQVVGMVL